LSVQLVPGIAAPGNLMAARAAAVQPVAFATEHLPEETIEDEPSATKGGLALDFILGGR